MRLRRRARLVWDTLRQRAAPDPEPHAPAGAGGRGTSVVTAADRWAAVDRALASMAARPEREPLRPSELLAGVRELADHGELDPVAAPEVRDARVARVRTVARRLIRQNRYAPVAELLSLVLPAWRPSAASGLQALAAHAATSLSGVPADDLLPSAEAVLQGADHAWAKGDVALASELVVIGAGLLLHRDLHVDVPNSPLAEDPEAYLAPLRRSAAMTALRSRPVRTPAPPETAAGQARRTGPPSGITRVVVLPGTYPRFAAPLVEALGRRPDVRVDVVDLPEAWRTLKWLGPDPDLVRLRLLTVSEAPGAAADLDGVRAQLGLTGDADRLLQQADVVVADWGDRGAVWASLVTPPTTRLVLRLHGMDALSLWVHALDWSAVDALVTVSPHHAALVDAVLRSGAAPAGERLPRCRAVPNVVRLPDARRDPDATLTLGMVGWGKRVKDPLWAVEVLAALRQRGGDWRLRLVGEPFRPGGVATGRDYARRFGERVAAADVAGAVDLVPQTDDVAGEVARVGFVLSTSLRESFHVGLVEGVLGGAVPVVRDWPFYARWGGPRTLFPQDWVVQDVEEAVERIWALREEADRAQEAGAALAEVRRRLDPERAEQDLLEAVLGDRSDLSPSTGPGS